MFYAAEGSVVRLGCHADAGFGGREDSRASGTGFRAAQRPRHCRCASGIRRPVPLKPVSVCFSRNVLQPQEAAVPPSRKSPGALFRCEISAAQTCAARSLGESDGWRARSSGCELRCRGGLRGMAGRFPPNPPHRSGRRHRRQSRWCLDRHRVGRPGQRRRLRSGCSRCRRLLQGHSPFRR